MTGREYLGQLSIITKRLWILHEEIERRRARLERITLPLKQDHVQRSGKPDALSDGIAALADKEVEYSELLLTYEGRRMKITTELLGLDNAIYAQLLYRIYVEEKTRAQTAAEMHYSPPYISTLQRKALEAFEKKYPELQSVNTI